MSNWLFPIAFFDSPKVLEATVTNIPGMADAPLQVIANLGYKASYRIDYIDSTGDYIGVYYGPIGVEKFVGIIGGGVNATAWFVIPAFSRVCLRSMTATAITNGKLMCSFMGC